MAQLADSLAYVNAREIERNEQSLASCFPPPSNELAERDRANLVPFARWAEEQRVPCCPARPATVGAFFRFQADHKISAAKILDTASSIEALHDAAGVANPVATTLVRTVLESVTDIKPPRSWTKDEKFSFALLPVDIRAAIERRENDRDKELRRLQNQTAELKRQSDSAETKPVISETKETTND
jgi:hypothetical protein